jgi:transcriptional regulator with GAF, ATPase, and Fis domain
MPPEIDDSTRALLVEVLKRSCDVIGCENSALWLASGDHLIPVLGHGPHAEHFIANYAHPLGEGIISMVYASGQPFCENHILANPQHSATLDQQLNIKTDAMITTPVIAQGEIAGVITCVHTSPAHAEGATDPATFQASDVSELEFAATLTGRILDSVV